MTDTTETETHAPRLFADDAAIIAVGRGLLARTLPREDWTHEAHLAAALWIIRDNPEIDAECDMPDIIRAYNVSVGGINDAAQGYHETITQTYIGAIRAHLGENPALSLVDAVNALLTSRYGRRDWPLTLYTPERLFSPEARLTYVTPDKA
jgi:hypothetical protein